MPSNKDSLKSFEEQKSSATHPRISGSPHSFIEKSATLVQEEASQLIHIHDAHLSQQSQTSLPSFDSKVLNYNLDKKRKETKGSEQSQNHRTKRIKHSTDTHGNHSKARVIKWVKSLPRTAEEVLKLEDMSDRSSQKRSRSSGDESARSGTTWNTQHRRNVINQFGNHGIMTQETRKLCEEEEMKCKTYLQGTLVPGACLMYSHDVLSGVIRDTSFKLESHV